MILSTLKWGALILQVLVLVYFSVHLLSTPQWERLIMGTFGLTSAVVLLAFGVYLLGYNPFWGHPLWHQGRLAALSNPNSVAGVAALNGIMALWVRERYLRGSSKWNAIVVLLGISVVVLYLTGSRTSTGAFLAGTLVWGWATGNMRWFFLLFGSLLVLLLVSEGYFYDITGQFRLKDPTNSREGVWQASYASWLERPWFGYGYGITGQRYTVTSLASAIGSVRDAAGYLGLLESIGIVGAGGLLAVYTATLRHVWTAAHLWRQGARSRELWIGVTTGTIFATLIVHAGGEAWIIAPGGFPHVLMWMSVGGVVFGMLGLRAKTHPSNRAEVERTPAK
ncbi:O-antigen ligase family protein [Salinibacter sp.]|uniref:O-antigen ligase family protein n=1 Tax=Salinibacter sp. TaxID=2065818 RepID=UPI0021E93FFA|nr:O-antigen ligase family protein [Salinibacter sp.]